jgi:polyhydroxyalkanoate synthesis repressor PhaR
VPQVRVIKKYPNRRLYDTESSAYITLAEVKQLVLDYRAFQVQDAKTGEDLTRSILLQIILEEESGGVPIFSSDMLANIIRYYGHSMQGLMGAYLERSIATFHDAQKRFQEQTRALYGDLPDSANVVQEMLRMGPQGLPAMGYLEKSAQAVIGMQEELSRQALKMFSGFPYPGAAAPVPPVQTDDGKRAAGASKRRRGG